MDFATLFSENHWIFVAFLAPMFWALVNIIDVYFVDGIYSDALDGVIISGLFQIIPLSVIFFVADFPASSVAIFGSSGILTLSFAGGIFYTTAFYFYFKALFDHNDVSMLQILWSLTVIAVPTLSFFIFGEVLPIFKYIGMAIALLGATMLSFNAKLRSAFSLRYFRIMIGAVLFLSLSMIFEERAYGLLGEAYGEHGFWLGFFFFSLGSFAAGLLFSVGFGRNPLPLIQKYYKIFLLGEGIYFLGNLSSQRALDIAPSASFVAVVETFVPVFVLIYSLLILFFFSHVSKNGSEVMRRIYGEQMNGIRIKILATIIMAAGVYMIG